LYSLGFPNTPVEVPPREPVEVGAVPLRASNDPVAVGFDDGALDDVPAPARPEVEVDVAADPHFHVTSLPEDRQNGAP
jgi:hypothetical protein